MFFTLCVLSVDMQNPLCAFHTLTVVSEEADITKLERIKRVNFNGLCVTLEHICTTLICFSKRLKESFIYTFKFSLKHLLTLFIKLTIHITN